MKNIVWITLVILASVIVTGCGKAKGGDDLESQVENSLKERVEQACYHEPTGVFSTVFERDDGILYYEGRNLDQTTTDMLSKLQAIIPNPSIRNSFTVTDTGKEFMFDGEGICVGTFEYDGLVSLTEPAAGEGASVTQVTFKVKFNPADWYKKAGMPVGVPKTASVKNPRGSTDEVQERFTIFQKMRDGWAKIDDWGLLD